MTDKKIPLHEFHPATPSKLPLDLIRLEDIPKIAIKPQPNRHTFYEVFWVTGGGGTHVIDFVEYEIQPNSLFFVGRGVVHYWNIRESLQGVVLLFKPDLFQILGGDNFLAQLDLFQANFHQSAVYPNKAESDWVTSIVQQIERELLDQNYRYDQMVVALFQMLLIRAQRLVMSQNNLETGISSSAALTRRYLKLIEKDAKKYHKVRHYADQMGVSIGHLSSCVKEVMGLNAGDLLRRELVLEAKRQLVHTNLTIGEVAYELNFADASYFGRFFKREAGQTPREFRSDFATKYQIPRTD
ncbi:MAG: helix-turn-helix transcriptional regulator [Chloroflexota bacterium]